MSDVQLPSASPSLRSRPSAGRRRLSVAVLVAWGVVSGLGLSSLGASHSAALPVPERDRQFAQAVAALLPPHEGLTFVHVIDPRCSCTKGLLAHLLARGPLPGVEERILFTGEDSALAAAASRAGFGYLAIRRDSLTAAVGLEVAPVLVALEGGDALRYVGGYFDHPSATVPLDTAILRTLSAGRVPEALPVYGCAVSDRLRRTLDPLGVVYGTR